MAFEPYQVPKPRRRRVNKVILIVAGSILGLFVLLAALGAALGSGKQQNTAAVTAPTPTAGAAHSGVPTYSAAASKHATTPTSAAPATSAAAAVDGSPSQTAAQQAYAGEMIAAGFFSGTPSWIIDADADAVCGSLQTESMSDEIAYEESVDENAATGMTTKADILKFVRASVVAFCPQYEPQLPAR